MKFDQWVLKILPIVLAGTILAVHLRHQASVSGPRRPLLPEGPGGSSESLSRRVLKQRTPETVTIPGTDGSFRMIHAPRGHIRHGNNQPRDTELQDFWIAEHEVTWKEYLAFWLPRHKGIPTLRDFAYDSRDDRARDVKLDGIPRPNTQLQYMFIFLDEAPDRMNFGQDDYPVTNARWHAAIVYCAWLSKQTGHRYRLPTEAEWEYACLAGSSNAVVEGCGESAWNELNSGHRTHPIAQKKPNPWGLYDMLGNVWEYCLEPQHPPEFGPVLRGGAWNSPSKDLGCLTRQSEIAEWLERDPIRPRSLWWFTAGFCQGFRVVRLEDGVASEERERYRPKVDVKIHKGEPWSRKEIGLSPLQLVRVTGELTNQGNRTLAEVELTVYYLDAKGAPHFVDVEGMGASQEGPGYPTFSQCCPVLVNSCHEGIHGKPLNPGETRTFAVDIPQSFDDEDNVNPKGFGARVSALLFAPN